MTESKAGAATIALTGVLLQCRPGFEKDCAAEAIALAAAAGLPAYCRAVPGSAYVELMSAESDRLAEWFAASDFKRVVFARQWFGVLRRLHGLTPDNRVDPILSALRNFPGPYADGWLEYPDSNEGRAIATFCGKFATPLRRALRRAQYIAQGGSNSGRPRLHLFFEDSSKALLGYCDPANASPWPLGIPRLKMPRSAPSRSALKLEEAFWTFLTAPERHERLAPGMTAVDLGAAPGGWTWQLVRRNIHVTAVDNGPMSRALLDSGLVEHKRVDGFHYRPRRAVDWLVCDMVEQPHRVTRLVADWLAEGLCREAVFNLKLPMKQRFKAVEECLNLLRTTIARQRVRMEWACKQLYHDREEVTVHVRRL